MEIKKEKEYQELVMDQKILSHPSTNIEIQKNFQNEPRSNGVYSRDIYLKT